RARQRLAGLPHARVERGQIPEDWPAGPFDLIVLSEIAYYFAGEDFDRLHQAVTATLEPRGTLLAVHWRQDTDYPLSGDEAHQRLAAGPWDPVVHHEEQSFVLDVWHRR
ncbi:MAG: class I SAM-dependent methyltransferase, partial [Acidimicrobiales bacterium]